jgi:hypothetical protein
VDSGEQLLGNVQESQLYLSAVLTTVSESFALVTRRLVCHCGVRVASVSGSFAWPRLLVMRQCQELQQQCYKCVGRMAWERKVDFFLIEATEEVCADVESCLQYVLERMRSHGKAYAGLYAGRLINAASDKNWPMVRLSQRDL